MALSKNTKLVICIVVIVVAIIVIYLVCKSKESFKLSALQAKNDKSGCKQRCGQSGNSGVPIWDTCGHICGMSKTRGTGLNLCDTGFTFWQSTGRKPPHWRAPNLTSDHDKCTTECGQYSKKVPIWDSCGHICSYVDGMATPKVSNNAMTLWGETGRNSANNFQDMYALSTATMCPSKTKYFP